MSPWLALAAASLTGGVALYTVACGTAWFWSLPRRTRIALLLLPLALLLAAGAARADAPACKPDTFYLVGSITPDIVPYFESWLRTAKNPRVVIDSPGGALVSSVDIIDVITRHGGVSCHVTRIAASGAFAILQACQTRTMASGARLGTHEPRASFPGYLERVAAATLLAALEAATTEWNRLCRTRLKLTSAEYDARVRGKDWVLDANEALAVGAVDRIAE